MGISLREIARRLGRITAISTPFAGVTWKAPDDHRQSIHQLLAYLEDRSVFFKPFQPMKCSHSPSSISESIVEIRSQITKSIQQLPPDSPAIKHLKRMRSACHRFLIKAGEAEGTFVKQPEPQSVAEWGGWYEALYVAIGEFRSVFGVELAELCLGFEIEPDQVFLDMLPLPDPDELSADDKSS